MERGGERRRGDEGRECEQVFREVRHSNKQKVVANAWKELKIKVLSQVCVEASFAGSKSISHKLFSLNLLYGRSGRDG